MDEFEELDHYAVLGVQRNATAEEIKRAYRQQIARYHPDRFATASPEEQAEASRRARRINEAYATLSDAAARTAYNRKLGLAAASPRAHPTPAAPAQPRDHLAELYAQARAHIDAGRHLQAIATLREIQRINPFYRDSGALLARAEAAGRAVAPPSGPSGQKPDSGRRALLVGAVAALFLAGIGAAGWALRRQGEATLQGATGAGPTLAPTGVPTLAPTGVPTLAPTSVPTLAPTGVPTLAPTGAPTLAPTSVPTLAPTAAAIAESGTVLYQEDFTQAARWPSIRGAGWSVGFAPGAYQITAAQEVGNIWAFNTSPAGVNFLVGVDVEVNGGWAGLLLRFNERNYLAYMVDPRAGGYRLLRSGGGRSTVLLEEQHPAVIAGEGARNRLAARLENERISLGMNGAEVADLSLADPPPTARYGMVAVATDAQVVALFRNLVIRSLD
ncbi:MAG: DnaJ domain-containing protein [Oscillochloridaceae bacterium]|nr:DnaJ domain-containing protein [Oscillochloridaceae bacterium]